LETRDVNARFINGKPQAIEFMLWKTLKHGIDLWDSWNDMEKLTG
jgi:hypothetical protein